MKVLNPDFGSNHGLKSFTHVIWEAVIICLIQDFEIGFQWKVNLKILNSEVITCDMGYCWIIHKMIS